MFAILPAQQNIRLQIWRASLSIFQVFYKKNKEKSLKYLLSCKINVNFRSGLLDLCL